MTMETRSTKSSRKTRPKTQLYAAGGVQWAFLRVFARGPAKVPPRTCRIDASGALMKISAIAALFALAAGMPRPASADVWTLTFSTYFGGNDMTAATAVAVDGAGDIYVAGWSDSASLPGCTPIRPNAGGVDAFVAKWDGTTHRIDYCTFLGGRGDDRAFAIAVDGSGYAYITGRTMSSNFPLSLPFQAALRGAASAFVTKLNPSGVLVYSSYLGGNGSDSGNGIAVDTTGNMTVVGSTTSTSFPVANPIQSSLNGQTNAFVTRLNPTGHSLLYSTYLGGNGNDYATAVALDSFGAAYLTGSTTSTTFPAVSAFQPASGGNQDAFVAKISSAGNELVYSTYLGGSGGTVGFPETGTGIAVDGSGDAYVTGTTSSQNFPLANALFSVSGGVGIHGFVAKLNPAGNGLLYSTFLGSSSVDQPAAIAVDSSGNAAAVGYTASPDFPVFNASQTALGGQYDAFVTRLNPAGTAVLGSTFFGGSSSDAANAVVFAGSGAICVAGQTQSLNLPLENATQSALAGAQNAFLAVFGVPSQVSAPAAPAGLSATGGNALVALSWTAPSGASSYDVYRGTLTGGESATAIATGIATTYYTDRSLANGTTYYYRVDATNSGGISPLSGEVSATPEPGPPAAPAGLTATAGNASVALAWTAPGGATSYNVYRGSASGGEGATAISSGVTTASYADTGLTNNTTYYYKVSAVDAGGTSPQSGEVSATPEPPVPAAPAGPTATAGNASVALAWTAPNGATSYNVYRGTTAGGEGTTAIASGITTVYYADNGVSNGTKYYYKVAAVNIGGIGAPSSEVFATPEPGPPAAPTGLTATAGNASVALSWTAPAGATSYNVYRGTSASGESATALVSGITATSYADNAAANGTRYYYKIAAVDSGGNSAQSTEASAMPEPPAPSAPVGLGATAGNGSVMLSWTAASGATSYNVYRGGTVGGEGATALASGIAAVSYYDAAVTSGTAYYYKVAAVNGGGTSALSGEASATPAVSTPAAPTGLTATAHWVAAAPAAVAVPMTNASFESPKCTVSICTPTGWSAVNAGTWPPSTGSFTSIPDGAQVVWANAASSLTQVLTTALALNTTYTLTVQVGARSAPYSFGPVVRLLAGTTVLGTASGTTPAAGHWSPWTLVVDSGTSNVSAGQLLEIYLGSTVTETTFDAVSLTAVADGDQGGSSAGQSSVALTWSASNNTTSYNVYRGTAAGGESTTPTATAITTTAYSDTGLTSGTTYYYKVSAVNGWGAGAVSSEVSATPAPPTPGAPTSLTATAGNGSVALRWTASSAATSYSVYRGSAAGAESATAIATGITTTSYSDASLANGNTYYYTVAAVTNGSVNAFSGEASAIPEPPAPAAPAGLMAIAGNGTVALGWTASSAATSYNVYRGTTAGGESTTALVSGLATTTYSDAAVANGTTYYYTVAAFNGGGTSPQSAEALATPEPPAPPAPTGLTATAANASVTLNWLGSSGATSYSVYRGTTLNGESATALASGIATTAYSDTAAANGTTYYYKVAAVDVGAVSALSGESSATPEPPAPAAPSGLTATPGGAFVALNWTASLLTTSYNVYRGTTSGAENTMAVASGITTNSYSDTGLTNGITYYYKVAAVNGGGTSALSGEASATPQPFAPVAPTGLTATGSSAGGATIPVTNSSFESPTCTVSICTPTGWSAVNAGTWPPSTSAFTSIPAGAQVVWANANSSLTQVLTTALASNTTYTLTVQVGARSAPYSFGPVVKLLAGTTVLGTASGTTPAAGYWSRWTLVFDSGASNVLAGQLLEIYLGSTVTETTIDAVSLTAVAEVSQNGSVALGWNASSNTTSYKIYRGTTVGGEGATPIATGITTASYSDTPLSTTLTYYYTVAAVNAWGTSAQSAEASAKPQ
jgi:fibronectin type 3 domain-containing protein